MEETNIENFIIPIPVDFSDDSVNATVTFQSETLLKSLTDLKTLETELNLKANISSVPTKTSDLINNSNFVTDSSYIHTDNNFTTALKTNLQNQSGTNTGDETNSTIKTKLGITTLSGINTGDQDLSGLVAKTTTINGHALNSNVTITATDVSAPTISSGSSSPASIPAKVGDIYIDTANYKTYISKGTNSSSDWIKQNGSYSLQGATVGVMTPSANTTYYFGATYSGCKIDIYNGNHKLYIPRAGIITANNFYFSQAPGSTENYTLYLRVNDTTDYLVSNTIQLKNYQNFYQITGLNIPVSAGSYINWKLVTPSTITTAPTSVSVNAMALIDL